MKTKNALKWLMLNADDGGGSGGDAGAGGSDGGDGGTGIDEALQQHISKVINAAQSSHSTRMAKQFDKRISEINNTFASQLDELKSLVGKAQNPEPNEPDTPPTPKGKAGEAIEAVRQEYNKKIEALQNHVQNAERARKEEKEKLLRQEERSSLTDALREKGVEGPLLKAAAAVLYTEEQRITRNDSGDIVFKMEEDGFEQEFSVNEGIAKWLETEEGRSFKPARPAAGSGAQRFNNSTPTTNKKKRSKQEAMAELQEVLKSNLV